MSLNGTSCDTGLVRVTETMPVESAAARHVAPASATAAPKVKPPGVRKRSTSEAAARRAIPGSALIRDLLLYR